MRLAVWAIVVGVPLLIRASDELDSRITPEEVGDRSLQRAGRLGNQLVTNKTVLSTTSKIGVRGVTFAVLSRIILMETPYIASWIRHYASIGVTSIHLLCNKPEEREPILAYLQKIDISAVVRVPVFTVWLHTWREPVGANAQLAVPGIIDLVRDDWLINVDVDEYWALGGSLLDLVTKQKALVYYAFWVAVVNDDMGGTPLLPPYQGSYFPKGKWMVETRNLAKFQWNCLNWPDMCLTYETKKDARAKPRPTTVTGKHVYGPIVGNLVHFKARSFWDVAMRSASQIGLESDEFAEGVNETLRMISAGHLPSRFLMLAFFAVQHSPKNVTIAKPLLKIDARGVGEKVTAGHVFGMSKMHIEDKMAVLHKTYLKFRNNVARKKQRGDIPGNVEVNWPKVKEWAYTYAHELGVYERAEGQNTCEYNCSNRPGWSR